MINRAIPTIPNVVVDIIDHGPPGPTPPDPTTFSFQWYQSLDRIQEFLAVIRNWPQQVQQGDLATFSKRLTNKSAGVQIWVPAPYNHILRWDGSAWTFGPGDGGSGFLANFLTPPTADGWAACDGSTVDFLLTDGTLGTQALPTTADLYFRR